MGIIRLIAILPYTIQLATGYVIGFCMWLLPLAQKKIILTNLRLCYPELGEQEQKRLAFRNFLSMGMSLIEIGMSWWSTDKHLHKLVTIRGLENLKHALQQGNGVILLSPHFTTLELGGRLLRLHTPFHVMYRHQSNALINHLMLTARERNFGKAIHRNDIKGLFRSLKDNMPVWYAPDQHFHGKQYVMAPFFNIPAASNPATSRLAKTSGARIVPFLQHRLPGLQGYLIELLPALEDIPGDSIEEDTALINKTIEALINHAPEQYLWAHKRFKTSLIDGKNPYIP
jgi:KDO2-lipid IV(A) lauroyltransferase